LWLLWRLDTVGTKKRSKKQDEWARLRPQKEVQPSILEVFGRVSRHQSPRLCSRSSWSCLVCKTSRSSPPTFSLLSKRFFSKEKAAFPPPLVILGYVPLPTFCSYCVQTPCSIGCPLPCSDPGRSASSVTSSCLYHNHGYIIANTGSKNKRWRGNMACGRRCAHRSHLPLMPLS